MERMERLNNILQPHIRASQIRLSYVEKLFPNLRDHSYTVLHKKNPDIQFRNYGNDANKEKSFDGYSTILDVSGSPLRYSFDNCDFEDTIVVTGQGWRKEEELYLPLSRDDACKALNLCIECLDNNNVSILALCDGKDPKQSRFIGTIVSDGWFTTLECVSTKETYSAVVKNKCRTIVKEHLKQSFVQEHEIKISRSNIFNLFGAKKEEIDRDKTAKNNFEGSINVAMYSDNLMLNTRLAKNILMVEINTGWKNSPLKELQNQLYMLIQYLSIIDQYKTTIEVEKPVKFTTPCLKEPDVIAKELNLLLNGNINFKKSDNIEGISYCMEENVESHVKLLGHVQNVSSRYDLDFTDFLWEILIGSSEYLQMVNSIEIVLKEILKHKYIPQVDDTNSTRFVKCISDLHRHETLFRFLEGSVPLELVIDMGFKKLTRDYLYILRGARFVNLYDIRQNLINISSGTFSAENYREKLITLARIHICLECMLFIEAHLEYPLESLQSIFAHIYTELLSEQSPLQHYDKLCNQFYSLTVPLPNAIANELSKMNPTIWKASLSSESGASMLTTTTYYSKMPIFPTDIYPADDAENGFYGVSAMSSSTKYKKL